MQYKNISINTISVQINRDYSVVAIISWNRDSKDYDIKFYLKRNDVDLLDYIYAENNVFKTSDIKSIKYDVKRYIEKEYKNKTFKKYTIRYEYMMKCFDKGNEFYENNDTEVI